MTRVSQLSIALKSQDFVRLLGGRTGHFPTDGVDDGLLNRWPHFINTDMNNREEMRGRNPRQKQHCDFVLWWIAQTSNVHWQQHNHTLVPGASGMGQPGAPGVGQAAVRTGGPALPQSSCLLSPQQDRVRS